MRPRELLEQVASYYPTPYDVDAVIARLSLEGLLKRPYGKLSGGQKRQVQFALAICGRPELLFLDEPTVGPRRAGARSAVESGARAAA